ncbi:Hint domain-containing protein [Roseomonas sp. CAU 1739]|uniref:Hint domain-containing protein n=1 Tax=Roseomonas sp. CAU 1739 TaxID=3140364 RepID=UPI00325AE1FA
MRRRSPRRAVVGRRPRRPGTGWPIGSRVPPAGSERPEALPSARGSRTVRYACPPDHALLVEGALIPARLLVDGAMIRRLPAQGDVTYQLLELEVHDIRLVEGTPSESCIDPGNRAAFDDAGVVRILHADFAPQRAGGMPRITEGPGLERARLALARCREAAGEDQRIAV